MVSKPTVTLPNEWVARSKNYARQVIDGYSNGRNSNSLAVSSHGAERDIRLQEHARMAECATCFHFGLDPDRMLNWSVYCDPGWDVIAHGVRWDVKATPTGCHLIWPINKRHIFESKRFDALILVRGREPTFTMVGFIIKPVFQHEHKIAPAGHVLDPGTWYMHENELWRM